MKDVSQLNVLREIKKEINTLSKPKYFTVAFNDIKFRVCLKVDYNFYYIKSIKPISKKLDYWINLAIENDCYIQDLEWYIFKSNQFKKLESELKIFHKKLDKLMLKYNFFNDYVPDFDDYVYCRLTG